MGKRSLKYKFIVQESNNLLGGFVVSGKTLFFIEIII